MFEDSAERKPTELPWISIMRGLPICGREDKSFLWLSEKCLALVLHHRELGGLQSLKETAHWEKGNSSATWFPKSTRSAIGDYFSPVLSR